MLVLEVFVPILAFAWAPIWMYFPCRNPVLAIGFLAPTFDVLVWLFDGIDSSLNTCVFLTVWMGLACVKLLSLTRSFALDVEVQMVYRLVLVEVVVYG